MVSVESNGYTTLKGVHFIFFEPDTLMKYSEVNINVFMSVVA